MTGGTVLALLLPMSLWSKARRADAAPPPPAGALSTETAFYEDQLREIERDLTRGLIAPAEADAARTEAARRLLRASRENPEAVSDGMAEPALRQRRAASAFALSTIPLVALIAYGLYGSPHMPSQTASDRQAVQSGGQDMLKAIGQIEARSPAIRATAAAGRYSPRSMSASDGSTMRPMPTRPRPACLGESPQRLSDWGEALVAGANGTVTPRAKEIFERAASLDAGAAKPRFYLARAAELEGAHPRRGPPADHPDGERPGRCALAAPGARDAHPPERRAPAATAKPGPSAKAPDSSRLRRTCRRCPPPIATRRSGAWSTGSTRRLTEKGGTADEWVRLVRSYGVLGDREKMKAALGPGAERGRQRGWSRSQARRTLPREFGLASAPVPPVTAADAAERAGTDAAVAAVKAMPAPERDDRHPRHGRRPRPAARLEGRHGG